jgi:hypothetical protein
LATALLFVIINLKSGSNSDEIFSSRQIQMWFVPEHIGEWQRQPSKGLRRSLRLRWLGSALLLLSSCSSAPPPLSIKMVNQETNQTLACSARDESSRADPSVLAAAVETCARQLEANGFVRQR